MWPRVCARERRAHVGAPRRPARGAGHCEQLGAAGGAVPWLGLCARGDQWQPACASWWLQRHREAAAPDAWGAARRQIINETLPALAKLRKEGTVRYVGFSGLPLDAFKYILDRRAPGARAGAGASTPALQGCGLRARRSHRSAAPRLSQGRRCSAVG